VWRYAPAADVFPGRLAERVAREDLAAGVASIFLFVDFDCRAVRAFSGNTDVCKDRRYLTRQATSGTSEPSLCSHIIVQASELIG